MKTTLISAVELAALAPEDVLIVDCRYAMADASQGERDYRAGHIPSAVFASLDHDLSDLSRQSEGLGRHPLPSESAFTDLLGRWGWLPGLQVVVYDTANGAMAASRLWWLLRLAGERAVAVLDGGLAAWQSAGLPLETGTTERVPTQVVVHYDPNLVILDHAAVVGQSQQIVLDARATPRYRGDVEPLDRVGGHIPGALNRPFADNLDTDGRFKPAAELKSEFLALIGAQPPEHVVHSCGSGVTACHNLLAMEHAGLHGSKLYAPSWSGWVSDPSRPVATGA